MTVFDLWRMALITCATVAAPFLLAALVVGLVTSLLQAATQLQENVIAFVPKLVALGLVLSLGGPWILERLVHYTASSFQTASELGRPGAIK